ncbi:RDD family protein [Streptomyces sp. NPDC059874]|uniref:RDD family protein n=1 Tax=Streptomyces sp. NPDC059874 TaxID=3346983 RepID=UPI003646580D
MAREGYYPDPSIPGFVRYWNGLSWVPGTSRPAAAVPAARSEETGPVFLDEPAVWHADPAHQAGFGGPRDNRVSWGNPDRPGISLARPPEPRQPGDSAEDRFRPSDPSAGSAEDGSRRAREDAGAPPQGAAHPSAPSAGSASDLFRRGRVGAGASPQGAEHDQPRPSDPSPRSAPEETPRRAPGPGETPPTPAPRHAQAAPAPAAPAPAWPDTTGPAVSGLTASWPEAEPRPAPAPAPEPRREPRPEPGPAREFRPEPRPAPAQEPRREAPGSAERRQPPVDRDAARPEVWPPRAGGARPVLPRTAQDAPAREPRGARPPAPRTPAAQPKANTADTARAVFERMAERAVRPAGAARRVTARALDSLVYAAVAAAAALPLVPGVTAHVQAKVDAARAGGRPTTVWLLDATVAGQLGLVLGAVLLFGILYEVLPTARWGRTPGKKLLGVRVLAVATLRPPRFGAALRRWLVYAFLGLPGSLWCLVDRPRRQAWHDKAAKTYVSR